LPFRAEIHSATALTPIASDFASATWVQCLGIGGGTTIETLLFRVPTMADDSALHFTLEVFSTADYSGTAVETFNSATAQTNLKISDGEEWLAFPSDGVGNPYYSEKLSVVLQSVVTNTQYYIRYKWFIAETDPTEIPWFLSQYPALEINNPESKSVAPVPEVFNTYTDAHNLNLADYGANVTVLMNKATANILNIYPSSHCPVGAIIPVIQIGLGATTITAGTGVSLNGTTGGTFTIAGQYAGAMIMQTAEDCWIVLGAEI